MNRKLLVSIAALISLLVMTHAAQAGILGAGLDGALRGAIVGNLLDGRNGAEEGAVIGGLIGAGEAASSENKKQQTEAAKKRQAEWEASQKAEQDRLRNKQAAAAPRKKDSG